ncbi:hypothetical protein AB0F59_30585, partial [Micromonospora lupini]
CARSADDNLCPGMTPHPDELPPRCNNHLSPSNAEATTSWFGRDLAPHTTRIGTARGGPGATQHGANTAQRGANTAQRSANTAQRSANTAQRIANTAQRGANTAQRGADTASAARTSQRGEQSMARRGAAVGSRRRGAAPG